MSNQRRLADVCEFIVDSEHKTARTQETGFPYIRTPNIGRGRLILADVRRISLESYQEWTRRAKPMIGDLILAREAPVGNVAIITSSEPVCLGQRTVLLRPNRSKADPYYLTYLLLGHEVQSAFHGFSTGAIVPHLNLSDIRGLVLPQLPPLEVQSRIGMILSTYDDLIENNSRRIEILEKMVRTIYREWFVHFRFPGHEEVGLVDSILGRIPEGWTVIELDKIAEVHRGRSYRGVNLVENGGWPFLNLKCIGRDGGFRSDGMKRYDGKFKETQVAESGSVVVAVTDMTQERRVVARAARVPIMEETKFVFSMDLVRIEAHLPDVSDYIYGLLRFSRFPDEVKEYANGVNVLHLSPDYIRSFKFECPPVNLQKRYSKIVSKLYLLQDVLNLRIAVLRDTRNLLLPKLVSGQIDVSDMEMKTPLDNH